MDYQITEISIAAGENEFMPDGWTEREKYYDSPKNGIFLHLNNMYFFSTKIFIQEMEGENVKTFAAGSSMILGTLYDFPDEDLGVNLEIAGKSQSIRVQYGKQTYY